MKNSRVKCDTVCATRVYIRKCGVSYKSSSYKRKFSGFTGCIASLDQVFETTEFISVTQPYFDFFVKGVVIF